MAASLIAPMASSLIQLVASSTINAKTGKGQDSEFLTLLALALISGKRNQKSRIRI